MIMVKNIILFPHKFGQLRDGINKTPDILRHFLRYKNKNITKIRSQNCLFKNLTNLYDANMCYTNPILNIGGDHSMSIATVAASLNKYKNLKVVWIDAHPDLNSYSASHSKNYHGMPVSFLTGIDKNKDFGFINNKLDFKNLLYIGIREIDNFEREVIDRYQIKYIKVNDINKDIFKCKSYINNFIKNDPVHLSFDVDCMDISEIYSTGTPVKNGIKMSEAEILLKSLNTKNIVNIDFTELNLEIGNDNQKFYSLANTLKLIDTFL